LFACAARSGDSAGWDPSTGAPSPVDDDAGAGSDAPVGDDAGDPAPSADATDDIVPMTTKLSIDATRLGFAIPANYVGLSVTSSNISGYGASEKIFANANSGNLANLLKQIGVKHLRTVSDGAKDTSTSQCPWIVDATPGDEDAFFAFAQKAGLGDASIIYSLHLFNEEDPASTASNALSAQHIWSSPYRSMLESFALDNESDWPFRYRPPCADPSIRAYFPTPAESGKPASPGYRNEWTAQYDVVQKALGSPSPAAPFSGPDTGSCYPGPCQDTSIGGVPFTLRFALDQRSRIDLATQHYYGGDSGKPVKWVPGAYVAGDIAYDPLHSDVTYKCIKDDPQSKTHPQAAPAYWAAYPPIWAAGTYPFGAAVQDPNNLPTIYKCENHNSCTTSLGGTSTEWSQDPEFGLLSARQMALNMLDPARLDDWQKLLDGALAGASTWPKGLHFRLTESNAYSGGQDPDSHNIATALWGLDYFHWWAARGCSGVDPFTRVVQYNAPIFLDPTTNAYVAAPYAYGMLAFSQGSSGTTVDPGAIQFSSPDDRVTAYAVVDASHMFVTIVNKTFRSVGAVDLTLTLSTKGFAAKQARTLTLESGTGSLADVRAPTAVLGGASIPTTGTWAGTWNPVSVRSDGTVGPLTVRATTAVVVDLSR
jgi:hypothetical protein